MESTIQKGVVCIDYDRWQNRLTSDRESYGQASPFPHIVLDDFLKPESAEKVLQVFPKVSDKGWIHYVHFNEKKHGLNKLDLIPPYIREVIADLNSAEFMSYLEELTGISNLLPDTSFEGGGIHQSEKGGFLNVHADFTAHPHRKNWRRRVNLLIYFNKDWREEYKGDLELWSRDMKTREQKIAPVFNRAVIFNTDETSYHGVPEPLNCPEGESRKSIALYYFTEEGASFTKRGTNYKARPSDGFRRVLIWLDKQVLWTYTRMKSMLGLNDDFASKLLNKLGGKKRDK